MSLFGSSQPDNGSAEPASNATPAPQYPAPANKKSPATVIAKGVRLEGEFKSQGDVLIEGEVHGTIVTEGLLTLGSEALLKATVTATDAIVAGKLEGNIKIKRKMDVKSTAKITGDLVCETITVESGAVLQGNIKAGVAQVPVPAPPKPTVPVPSFVKTEEKKEENKTN
jgi:cytoskeletal protein CcmA (bactofilin family)